MLTADGDDSYCLKRGVVGELITDDASGRPYEVRCNGDTSWYEEKDVQLATSASAASKLESRLKVGQTVVLADDFRNFGDAAAGCLQPGDEGVIVKDDLDSKPFKVRASNGCTWFYAEAALRPASGSSSILASSPGLAFQVGDAVRVRSVSPDEAERLQNGHGGWASSMASLLGKVGTVERLWDDGDITVHDKCWNPAMIVSNGIRPGQAVNTLRLRVGDRVILTADGDASRCLKRGDVGDIVTDDGSGRPFKVRCNGDTSWYEEVDLQRASSASERKSEDEGFIGEDSDSDEDENGISGDKEESSGLESQGEVAHESECDSESDRTSDDSFPIAMARRESSALIAPNPLSRSSFG
jgi:hypothetical protein